MQGDLNDFVSLRQALQDREDEIAALKRELHQVSHFDLEFALFRS